MSLKARCRRRLPIRSTDSTFADSLDFEGGLQKLYNGP